jgi:diguanylate cyclase (GGDEF)-like protein
MKEITVTIPADDSRSMVKRFLAVFVPLAIGLVIIAVLVYRGEINTANARMDGNQLHAVDLQTYIIERNFRDVLSDLMFLTLHEELQNILQDPSTSTAATIAREYEAFSLSKGLFDRIRLLNDQGMEVVTVDYNGGRPVVVPEMDLRSQAESPCFRESIQLNRGEVFVSQFELGMRDGKPERPLKPIIRFGSPVFDKRGRKRGVVVLSYLGTKLIEDLRRAASTTQGDLMLLNTDGYWIMGPNPEDEWGFALDNKKNRTFGTDYPDVWRPISRSTTGQIRDDDGLFTFATIFPLIEGRRTSAGSARGPLFETGLIQGKAYGWKVVSHVPPNILSKPAIRILTTLIPLFGFLILLAGTSSWYLARASERARRAEEAFKFQVSHDPLTGIWNRSGILELARREFGRSKREGSKVAMSLVNLDRFKTINDKFGHSVGDEVLREVSRRICRSVREYDSVGRYGGDEFLVVLPGCGKEEAERVTERFRAAVEDDPISVETESISVTIARGTATTETHECDDAEALITLTDQSLSRTKPRATL